MGVLIEGPADPELDTSGKADRVYRPSSILLYEDCPRAYYFRFRVRPRPEATSANKVFGTAAHAAVAGYLLGKVQAGDMADAFRAAWRKGLDAEPVEFSSTWDPESMEAVGMALCGQFPAWWSETGLAVIGDLHGPLVERRLRAEIAPGISLSGQPDIVAMTGNGEIAVIDVKTPASAQSESWWSDQLTAYQILVEHHGRVLQVDSVQHLGFVEMLKQKTNPRIRPVQLIPARTREDVAEYVRKVIWTDRDIEEGRFPRRGRMAHNTPCGMCEYQTQCLKEANDG